MLFQPYFSLSFSKGHAPINEFSTPHQKGNIHDNKSPTHVGYPNKRSNKHVLNRQNSGLSTSIPLPPISKGISPFPSLNKHIYIYTIIKYILCLSFLIRLIIFLSDPSKFKTKSIPGEDEEFCSILPLNAFPFPNSSFSSDPYQKQNKIRKPMNSFDDSQNRYNRFSTNSGVYSS